MRKDKDLSVERLIKENEELRQAIVELRKTENQYRSLADNALVGITRTNLKGKLLYANPTYLNIFGYDTLEEARAVGSLSRYRNPEDRKTLMEILKQYGKVANFEAECISKTGHSVYVLLSAVLEGDVITAMLMDISEHKKADEALAKSESLYRLLAENVSDVIWTMDLDLNFTYISPSIARFRGVAAKKAIHQSLREVVTPDSYEIIWKAVKRGLAREDLETQAPFYSQVLELEHIRNDGSQGWAEVRVSFLRDEDGKPKGILGVTRDITHRKEAEKALTMKSRSLEEVNTALKVLLEQREKDKKELEDNILFNVKKLIQPYLDFLKQRQLDDEQKIYLDVIETNLKNIISPFAKKLTSIHERFTPQEIKIADFIRDGKTVKEIARALGVSDNAINVHRQHIRNKLGLNNQKMNLRTYLLSLA